MPKKKPLESPSRIPQTPAVAADRKRPEGGAPLADDLSVAEAKAWVDENAL